MTTERVETRGSIRRRILALAGVVPFLVSAPAQAEPRDIGPFDVVGAGVFVGYTFGAERGLDWGIEGFATRYFEKEPPCASDERSGFGPLVRLSMLNASRLSFTGAGHLGGEVTRGELAGGLELGGTAALNRDGWRGAVHTGVMLESIVFNVYARKEWLLKSTSLGAGARFLPTYGVPGFCVVGRAFRDGAGASRGRASCASQSFAADCPEAARWAARSGHECESVLAFLQLALELLDEGAPCALVARALRSAEQELFHTWAAAALAARYGGAPLVPRSPTPHFRARLPRHQQIARLAREGWVDGCLNEGLAALVAAEEARDSADPEEARISRQIALDEAEHALLALDVVRWALAQGQSLPERAPLHADATLFGDSPLGAARVRELAALQSSTASASSLEYSSLLA
jgi:hypothetical protein